STTKKSTMAADPLTENEWRLTELMGKAIPSATEPMNNITLKFNKAENRVNGFSGCNLYNGGFTIPAPLRISFTQMISTMKACPTNMELESEYLKMLSEVDNYTLNGNVLSLNKARMAPMAKFESVRVK
ncbi:MAG: META domain-containing protein, partial [Chitinophagaceae bacterium]